MPGYLMKSDALGAVESSWFQGGFHVLFAARGILETGRSRSDL